VIGELESMQKKVVVDEFVTLSQHLAGESEESHDGL
jgi:hypothetical protein